MIILLLDSAIYAQFIESNHRISSQIKLFNGYFTQKIALFIIKIFLRIIIIICHFQNFYIKGLVYEK